MEEDEREICGCTGCLVGNADSLETLFAVLARVRITNMK